MRWMNWGLILQSRGGSPEKIMMSSRNTKVRSSSPNGKYPMKSSRNSNENMKTRRETHHSSTRSNTTNIKTHRLFTKMTANGINPRASILLKETSTKPSKWPTLWKSGVSLWNGFSTEDRKRRKKRLLNHLLRRFISRKIHFLNFRIKTIRLVLLLLDSMISHSILTSRTMCSSSHSQRSSFRFR